MATLDDLLNQSVPGQQKPKVTLDTLLAQQGAPEKDVSVVHSTPIPGPTDEELVSSYTQSQMDAGLMTRDAPAPGFIESLQQEFPEMAVGMAGSVKGGVHAARRSKSLPPLLRGPAILGGMVFGGAGGAGLGKFGQQSFRNLQGDVIPFDEILEESLNASLRGGRDELIGFGFGKAVGPPLRILRRWRNALLPIREGAKEAATIASRGGSVVTMSQVIDNNTLRAAESFAEKFQSGGKLRHFRHIDQVKAIQRSGAELQDQFTRELVKTGGGKAERLTSTNAGVLMHEALQGARNTFNAASRGMYGQVDKAVKAAGLEDTKIVDLRKLKRLANTLIGPTGKEAKRVANELIRKQIEQAKKLGKPLTKRQVEKLRNQATELAESQVEEMVGQSPGSLTLAKKVASYPDFFSFKGGIGFRSAMIQEKGIDVGVAGTKTPRAILAERFVKMVHRQMDEAGQSLQGQSKEAFDAWGRARAFHKAGLDNFNHTLIKQLDSTLEDNPEKLVDMLFKEDAVTGVRILTKVLGDPQKARKAMADNLHHVRDQLSDRAWTAVKGSLVKDMFKTAMTETKTFEPLYNPQKVLQQLNTLGPEVVAATYSKQELGTLRRFLSGSEQLLRVVGGLPGQIAVPLAEVGAVSDALIGNFGKLAAVIGIPKALAKFATNPRWTEIALNGSRPDASRAGIVKLASLIQRMTKEETEKERGRERVKRQQQRPNQPLGTFGGQQVDVLF